MTLLGDDFVRKIGKNFGIVFCGNSASAVLGLVSFTLMARALGPELLAYFALSQAYVRIINDIFNVQTWESMLKFGAGETGSKKLASLVKTNLVLDLVSAWIAFGFSLLMLQGVASYLGWTDALVTVAEVYIWVIPFTLTTLTIGVPRWCDRFFLIAKIQFGVAIIKVVLISVLFFIDSSVTTFVAVYVLAEVLLNCTLIFFSVRLLNEKLGRRWWHSTLQLDLQQLTFLWWTNLRTIVRIPVRHLDVVLINLVMSVQAVGIYKVYKELIEIINRFGDPLNQTLYPEYARIIGRGQSDQAVHGTRRLMLLLSLLCVVIVVGLLLASKPVLTLFFGEEYLTLLPALYALIVLAGISLFLTPVNSLFIAAGFARYSFYLVLVSNLIYLLVAYMAGQLYGIYGVVGAFALQIAINKGAKLLLLKRHTTGWADTVR